MLVAKAPRDCHACPAIAKYQCTTVVLYHGEDYLVLIMLFTSESVLLCPHCRALHQGKLCVHARHDSSLQHKAKVVFECLTNITVDNMLT